MKLTLVQAFVTTVLPPAWAEAIRSESQDWTFTCTACGAVRSVWEAGGIRFGAASAGKSTVRWCEQCGRLRVMTVTRRAAKT